MDYILLIALIGVTVIDYRATKRLIKIFGSLMERVDEIERKFEGELETIKEVVDPLENEFLKKEVRNFLGAPLMGQFTYEPKEFVSKKDFELLMNHLNLVYVPKETKEPRIKSTKK